MTLAAVETIRQALASGLAIPYLGPGVLALAGEGCPLPASHENLVDRLTAKASVPHKIKKNLTAAAQFIENFKHRKTVAGAMTEAFRAEVAPTALHRHLAAFPALRFRNLRVLRCHSSGLSEPACLGGAPCSRP